MEMVKETEEILIRRKTGKLKFNWNIRKEFLYPGANPSDSTTDVAVVHRDHPEGVKQERVK